MIASTLALVGLSPSADTMCPRYSTCEAPKIDFSGWALSPTLWMQSSTLDTCSMCVFMSLLKITRSST